MEWLILLLVLVAVVVGVAPVVTRKSPPAQPFGAEDDRAVDQHGDRRRAEAGLWAVAKRRVELDIRPLSAESRDQVLLRGVTARPASSTPRSGRSPRPTRSSARSCASGRYPTGDFDEQVAMVAADHGDRADDYRQAYAIHRAPAPPPPTTCARPSSTTGPCSRPWWPTARSPRPTPSPDGERAEPPTWGAGANRGDGDAAEADEPTPRRPRGWRRPTPGRRERWHSPRGPVLRRGR